LGHFCRLCGRHRANERFSGGGHRIHVCRECQRRPDRLAIEARIDIERMLFRQSHISDKNFERLRTYCDSPTPEIVKLAAIVLQIAAIAPYKRKRFSKIRRLAPRLIQDLVDLGLLEPRLPEDFEYDEDLEMPVPEEPGDREIIPPSSSEVLRDDIPF
jgi:hypothetical protein